MLEHVAEEVQAVVDRLHLEGHTVATRLENALGHLLNHIREDSTKVIDEVKADIAEVKAELAPVVEDVKSDTVAVVTEVKADVAEIVADVKKDLSGKTDEPVVPAAEAKKK